MRSYTYVMNFRGGTYISQVKSDSVLNSLDEWVKELDITQVKYLGIKSKSELVLELSKENPTPLKGLRNVWCVHFVLSVGSVLINIIQTDSSSIHG